MRAEWVHAASGGAAIEEIGAFVRGSASGTGYASPVWVLEMCPHLGGVGGYIAARDDRLRAVLPVLTAPLHDRVWWPTLGIERRESLGYDCYGGPLFAPDLSQEERSTAFRALAAAAKGSSEGRGGGSLAAAPWNRSRVALVNILPPAWRPESSPGIIEEQGFRRTAPYEMVVKDLRGLSLSDLPRSYHPSHRRSVDAFPKRGARVRQAEGPRDYLCFADLLNETMRRGASSTTRFPVSLLVDGGKRLVRADVARLWLATIGDTIVAGIFIVMSGRNACYWLGASVGDGEIMRSRPMHGLFHRAFSTAIEAGCEFFELGGMATEGLRDFKTRWGVEHFTQHTFQWSPWAVLHRARALGSRRG